MDELQRLAENEVPTITPVQLSRVSRLLLDIEEAAKLATDIAKLRPDLLVADHEPGTEARRQRYGIRCV